MSQLLAGTTSTSIPSRPIRQALLQPWHTVDLLERGPYPDLKRKLNVETGNLAQAIDSAASLRIVIGLSDVEDEWCSRSLGRLYEFFKIPDEFTSERVQYIPTQGAGLVGAVRYWKAGFFIRRSASLGTTLVCFAPLPEVLERLELFIDSPSWSTACKTPYILFNVILGALFLEVDEMVWTMGTIFNGLEREITDHVDGASNFRKQQYYKPPFGTLHRYANDLAYLKETIESNLLVAEAMLDRTRKRKLDNPAQDKLPPTEEDLLEEGLLYHRSLFRSTQLRLCSLDKRIQNANNLAFNMVTQQDSLIMMQDSASVAILSTVAAAFLPITSIATVVGSQLFDTRQDNQGNWTIVANPLIRYLYIIGIPLTLVVFIASYLWSIRHPMSANTWMKSCFKLRLRSGDVKRS
ncbi:hypothetical protein J7T55_003756 [Diaporthe amygdali]|uniref:uncharacterized protein n=1 Tax=Phomopsis amygdali TaxID=1214568 RepID=UPI0022FEF378|nr:uncharacterized protein J7T55_003756 [Diaporthe amygdali]KAJ0117342.1 hypothetical protein J7T55_003756 [Diaporthe amygdali]